MSDPNRNIIDLTTESALAGGLSDIANAIGKFKLNAGAVTVANGAFTLLYEGDAPQTAPTTATVKCDIKGTSQTGLSYTVSYSNGVATFTLSGTADGVYTQAVSAVIVLGDDAVPITITGLPVMYAPMIEQPVNAALEWDFSAANTIDFSPYVFPKNVSPSIDYGSQEDDEIDAIVYEVDEETGALTPTEDYFELDGSNSFSFTIPANTFETGKSYFISIEVSTGLLGETSYLSALARYVIYEQGAE